MMSQLLEYYNSFTENIGIVEFSPEESTEKILPDSVVLIEAEIERMYNIMQEDEQLETVPLPATEKKDGPEITTESSEISRILQFNESEVNKSISRKRLRESKNPKRDIKSKRNADGKYDCKLCGKSFRVQKTFLNHLLRHEHIERGSFACPVCKKRFGSKERLARHSEVHNRDLTCKYCGHESENGHQYRIHRITHQAGHYKCRRCIFSCDSSEQLDQHKKSMECTTDVKRNYSRPAVQKNRKCSFEGCEYTTESYATMYFHKRSKHLQQFSCNECGKRFAFASQLRSHEHLHTGEKPFQCQICSKDFRLLYSFKEHMATHEGTGTHACDVCGKSFSRPRYLTTHRFTHSDQRPYECTICGARYKKKGELTKHTRTKHRKSLDDKNCELTEEGYDYESLYETYEELTKHTRTEHHESLNESYSELIEVDYDYCSEELGFIRL